MQTNDLNLLNDIVVHMHKINQVLSVLRISKESRDSLKKAKQINKKKTPLQVVECLSYNDKKYPIYRSSLKEKWCH